MMTPGQIRGMLLEEAVLHLLQQNGYRTIDDPGSDPTLCEVGAGLAVHGRGTEHQIDAIADFIVRPPFSNQQRLLVEAKCYDPDRKIGIDVVRNAVGVFKDVSEFWVASRGKATGRTRYHYQYAIFSSTDFSVNAQRYAFAQDIYLFPLNRSKYIKSILTAIYSVIPTGHVELHPSILNLSQLSELRVCIRQSLRAGNITNAINSYRNEFGIEFEPFIHACHQLNYMLVTVLGGIFPVILAPNQDIWNRINDNHIEVRIFWDQNGWYLQNIEGENLFSFNLPEELYNLYAHEGELTPDRALDLKETMMSSFQAIEMRDGRARIINFVLDRDWFQNIRRDIG